MELTRRLTLAGLAAELLPGCSDPDGPLKPQEVGPGAPPPSGPGPAIRAPAGGLPAHRPVPWLTSIPGAKAKGELGVGGGQPFWLWVRFTDPGEGAAWAWNSGENWLNLFEAFDAEGASVLRASYEADGRLGWNYLNLGDPTPGEHVLLIQVGAEPNVPGQEGSWMDGVRREHGGIQLFSGKPITRLVTSPRVSDWGCGAGVLDWKLRRHLHNLLGIKVEPLEEIDFEAFPVVSFEDDFIGPTLSPVWKPAVQDWHNRGYDPKLGYGFGNEIGTRHERAICLDLRNPRILAAGGNTLLSIRDSVLSVRCKPMPKAVRDLGTELGVGPQLHGGLRRYTHMGVNLSTEERAGYRMGDYFETAVRCDQAEGFWPAVWSTGWPAWPPEIDWVEVFCSERWGNRNPNEVTLHSATNGQSRAYGARVGLEPNIWPPDFSRATGRFVRFGGRIEPDYTYIYVDRILVGKAPTPLDFTTTEPGSSRPRLWDIKIDATAQMTASRRMEGTLEVDYVRVHSRKAW